MFVNPYLKNLFTICEYTVNTDVLTFALGSVIIESVNIPVKKGGLFSQMENSEHKDPQSLQAVLAKNLRMILAERDITQSELAKRTGLAPSTISSYLNCTRFPRADQLNLIADALNIPVYELTDKLITHSQDEDMLLSFYRDLSPRMRDLMLDIMMFLVERQSYKSLNTQEKRKVIVRLASDRKGT